MSASTSTESDAQQHARSITIPGPQGALFIPNARGVIEFTGTAGSQQRSAIGGAGREGQLQQEQVRVISNAMQNDLWHYMERAASVAGVASAAVMTAATPPGVNGDAASKRARLGMYAVSDK